MPLYEYQCGQCGRRTEKRQKFSDALLTDCPFCGGPLKKLISAPAVQFKGGGWYADGYGSAKTGGSANASADAAASGSAGEGGAAKTDSTSGGSGDSSSGKSTGTTSESSSSSTAAGSSSAGTSSSSASSNK